jgi:hypothetical protein
MTGISLTKFLKDFSFRTCSFIFSRITIDQIHILHGHKKIRIQNIVYEWPSKQINVLISCGFFTLLRCNFNCELKLGPTFINIL